MFTLAEIDAVVQQEHLFVSGILTTSASPDLPDGVQTLVLLSPLEPGFWGHFSASPQYRDGKNDPLDRWSMAAADRLTHHLTGARPYFPFGGPPWHPFIGWALASGRAVSSPVGLLAHDHSGLFISFRMALGFDHALPVQQPKDPPCAACPAPCTTACPVAAFASGSYDVQACKAHVRSEDGIACRTGGCLVRRACPVGQSLRLPAQSEFHMEAFL